VTPLHKTQDTDNRQLFSILFIDLEVELRLSDDWSFFNSEFQQWFLKQTHHPKDYLHCGGGFIVRPCPYKSKEISFSFSRFPALWYYGNPDKQLANVKPVSFLFRACSKGRLSVWEEILEQRDKEGWLNKASSCFIVAMIVFGCVIIFDVLLFWAFTCLSSSFSPLQSTQFSLGDSTETVKQLPTTRLWCPIMLSR